MSTGSNARALAFPKPLPQMLEREERRARQRARERVENAKVRRRSGGRCEVVLDDRRCRKSGREIHHLLGGHGRRGRGESLLATHKVHACAVHHRLMQLRWITAAWTTPDTPVDTIRFQQMRGTRGTRGA